MNVKVSVIWFVWLCCSDDLPCYVIPVYMYSRHFYLYHWMVIFASWQLARREIDSMPIRRCISYHSIVILWSNHDDVIKWKHFPRHWPFVRETTGHRWILLIKASDAELWCFLWSAPEKKRLSKQSIRRWFETPSPSLWRHRNVIIQPNISHSRASYGMSFVNSVENFDLIIIELYYILVTDI